MKWAEVAIETTHEANDIVAEIFKDLGAGGVVVDDPELINSCISEGGYDFSELEQNTAGAVTVKAYLPFDDKLDDTLRELNERINFFKNNGEGINKGSCAITWKIVADEDWADNWKAYFHPAKVGEKIVIKPTWEDYKKNDGDLVVELDPGAAFGTGLHPTTAMCIRELEKLVTGDKRIFDVGTGSGVLAITAARLGATDITAMDYDRTAVTIAAENIAQNNCENIIKTGVSDLLQNFDGKADLIIANIIADIIIRLFSELDKYLAANGVLLASGIITERLAEVKAAAENNGFVVQNVIYEKGWAAMEIGRKL